MTSNHDCDKYPDHIVQNHKKCKPFLPHSNKKAPQLPLRACLSLVIAQADSLSELGEFKNCPIHRDRSDRSQTIDAKSDPL